MQLHPQTFSVPWHSGGDNSELSMPLGHLSRHYSTDRSSSLGSMESLENPSSQGYYDSQLSPIDPAIFNNKRDSAYSSFSASSNTSDYTVSLRPEENSSMDSLLQGLGPSCRFTDCRPHYVASGPGELHCEEGNLKSRSLARGPVAKARPSSYSYEEEKCGPPQPPIRKDSFRAARGRPGVTDKRCVSAPVGILNMTCCMIESPSHLHEGLNGSGCLNNAQENGQDLKGNSTEPYYTLSSERGLSIGRRDVSTEFEKSSHVQPLERNSPRLSSPPVESPETQVSHLENHLPSRMHRHSAPEKLLASQLHMMELSNNNNEHSTSPASQWSHPVHPREDLREDSPDVAAQGKWGGSRCSTPGSLTTSEIEDQRVDEEPFDSGQSVSPIQHSWGRSVSVPNEPARNGFSGSAPSTDTDLLERDFGPISAAASMDTLLEEDHERGEGRDAEVEVSKPPQKRQFRSSKSRRRSERFATNLRNEIQRKKAQLQKNKGPGGLPCSEDTVEEEDGANLHLVEEEPPEIHQPRAETKSTNHTSFQNTPVVPPKPRRTPSDLIFQQNPDKSCGINSVEHSKTKPEDTQVSQHDIRGIPSTEVTRPVGVHVVEEVAPAGKARRWRWTPENKLQPEIELAEKKSGEGRGPSSWKPATTRGRVGSSSGRSSRTEDCDIPPFADRRKFFEETIRNLSQSVTNLASLTSRHHRPERQGRKDDAASPDPHQPVTDLGRRRFSYQGGVHDGTLMGSLETRRQYSSAQQERDREREKMMEKERERVREQEREREREREQERLKEQERLREQERLQAWEEEQREKEQERERERVRKEAEREQQRVEQMERKWETDRDAMYASHDFTSIVTSPPLPHVSHLPPSLPSQNVTTNSCHPDSSHSEASLDIPKPYSAFRPVMSQQYQSDHYGLHPGYKARSRTPTEAHPVRQMEQTKLNRKFSLTERDYAPCRRDSRPAEVTVGPDIQGQWNGLRVRNNGNQPFRSSLLRNRAMSENDLRVETLYVQSHTSAKTSRLTSSTLTELDENIPSGDEAKKKKGPPPPRPPPPKWGQFHKRRASHHNLFSPPVSSPQMQTYSPRPPIVHEMSRQRSYSLPPRDGTENCQQCLQECSVAPPSPAFSRRAFKPVAPPPKEREAPSSHHYDINRAVDTSPPSDESSTRLAEQSWGPPSDRYRSSVVKPVFHKHKAEWDLTSLQNSSTINSPNWSSGTAPSLENGLYPGAVSPESYFSMNNKNNYQQHFQNQPQQVGFPGATLKSLEHSAQSPPQGQDHGSPLETDIDEFHEKEGTAVEQQRQEEGRMEMQCFAQPVTVLETDIDTLTDEETALVTMKRVQRASLVDSLLEKDCGRARKELMGELFPHCTEAGSGGEGWRGGYPVSGDTLERSSRQGSSASASTNYSATTSKAQLLNKMKDFSDMKEEDEELNYKKQLMESLRKKLGVLRDAQRGLQEDIRANAQLGEEVESLVLAVCKPNEVDKFRMFIGDLDKVTSLLLSLSGRLLRVESALDCLDPESGHTERLPLMEKKKQLLAQLAEAQELKEHVDRREQAVGRVLGRCLTPEQLRDYSHFVKMKAALLVEQRQLDDKIRLGEEQLRGLRESLGLGLGVRLAYGH